MRLPIANVHADPGVGHIHWHAAVRGSLTWPCFTVLGMAKAARVLAALKRGGWIGIRRSGSHWVLSKGDQQRICAYHDGADLGAPAMARIARDYFGAGRACTGIQIPGLARDRWLPWRLDCRHRVDIADHISSQVGAAGI